MAKKTARKKPRRSARPEADTEIKLVRHGESRWQTGEMEARTAGDHRIALSDRGHTQARAAGKALGTQYLEDALVYVSPYTRTRETFASILAGAGAEASAVRSYEDPRLREVEHGYKDAEEQLGHRETHGWFYYRFDGGESPADCFDRVSGFIESMWRQLERKKGRRKVLIVTHGLTIRCFVMRFLHLKVEECDTLANPDNCDVVTIKKSDGKEHVLSGGGWVADGMRLRSPPAG